MGLRYELRLEPLLGALGDEELRDLIVTRDTSVQILAGFLIAQRQCVFSIKACNHAGVDVATATLRAPTGAAPRC